MMNLPINLQGRARRAGFGFHMGIRIRSRLSGGVVQSSGFGKTKHRASSPITRPGRRGVTPVHVEQPGLPLTISQSLF